MGKSVSNKDGVFNMQGMGQNENLGESGNSRLMREIMMDRFSSTRDENVAVYFG